MKETEELCPAKVNLFLAVTGRREDGFHELVSVMAPIDLKDRLRLAWREETSPGGGGGISFSCDNADLPTDEGNLVLRAVAAFRRRHPFRRGLRIELKKRIPVGAGLGGGSSDAAGLLVGLNRLLGSPLRQEELCELAATIGSDCPFFVTREAAVVRGRGERVDVLSEEARARLRGTRLFLMKPSFPISTAWAYGALARMPGEYCSRELAEERLSAWLGGSAPVRELMFNNLERPVFRKFIALPALKGRLEGQLGLSILMSGSGSTLFAAVEGPEAAGTGKIEAVAKDSLGPPGWMEEVRVL